MKKRTILNLLLFAFLASFFLTPIGYESKIILQRIFAKNVDILEKGKQYKIDENWVLKDKNNNKFNFNVSEGKVKVVYFWRSWEGISLADLPGIEKLYNDYKDKVDFYIITNEDPTKKEVEKVLNDRKLNFKVTYEIIEEKSPFDTKKIPSGYIIDKNGVVVASTDENSKWNGKKVRELLDILTK